jgi:integrase
LVYITLRQRRRAFERFVAWVAEHWPSVRYAGEVDRACAAGFAAWLAKQGGGGKVRRNLIADLGTVWEGLRHVRDDVTFNPWPLVLPADDSERGKAFTLAQELAVIKAADEAGHGWGLACRLARYGGLRYGDVARLQWASVDLVEGVIRLSPAKTSRHGVGVVIPLCAALAAALAAAAASAGQEPLVLPEHAAVYPAPVRGAPGAFACVLSAAGVSPEDYNFHSWRHTFRTRLSEAGVSDEIAKRLGGWTVDATAMRYDHDGRIEELRDAVQRGAGCGLNKSRRGAPAASCEPGKENAVSA